MRFPGVQVVKCGGVGVVLADRLDDALVKAALQLQPRVVGLHGGRLRRGRRSQGERVHQRQERWHHDEDGLMAVEIKFEANQQYQLDAINSVVDLFAGQEGLSQGFTTTTDLGGSGGDALVRRGGLRQLAGASGLDA